MFVKKNEGSMTPKFPEVQKENQENKIAVKKKIFIIEKPNKRIDQDNWGINASHQQEELKKLITLKSHNKQNNKLVSLEPSFENKAQENESKNSRNINMIEYNTKMNCDEGPSSSENLDDLLFSKDLNQIQIKENYSSNIDDNKQITNNMKKELIKLYLSGRMDIDEIMIDKLTFRKLIHFDKN